MKPDEPQNPRDAGEGVDSSENPNQRKAGNEPEPLNSPFQLSGETTVDENAKRQPPDGKAVSSGSGLMPDVMCDPDTPDLEPADDLGAGTDVDLDDAAEGDTDDGSSESRTASDGSEFEETPVAPSEGADDDSAPPDDGQSTSPDGTDGPSDDAAEDFEGGDTSGVADEGPYYQPPAPDGATLAELGILPDAGDAVADDGAEGDSAGGDVSGEESSEAAEPADEPDPPFQSSVDSQPAPDSSFEGAPAHSQVEGDQARANIDREAVAASPLVVVTLSDDQARALIGETLAAASQRDRQTLEEIAEFKIEDVLWQRDCQLRAVSGDA